MTWAWLTARRGRRHAHSRSQPAVRVSSPMAACATAYTFKILNKNHARAHVPPRDRGPPQAPVAPSSASRHADAPDRGRDRIPARLEASTSRFQDGRGRAHGRCHSLQFRGRTIVRRQPTTYHDATFEVPVRLIGFHPRRFPRPGPLKSSHVLFVFLGFFADLRVGRRLHDLPAPSRHSAAWTTSMPIARACLQRRIAQGAAAGPRRLARQPRVRSRAAAAAACDPQWRRAPRLPMPASTPRSGVRPPIASTSSCRCARSEPGVFEADVAALEAGTWSSTCRRRSRVRASSETRSMKCGGGVWIKP